MAADVTSIRLSDHSHPNSHEVVYIQFIHSDLFFGHQRTTEYHRFSLVMGKFGIEFDRKILPDIEITYAYITTAIRL